MFFIYKPKSGQTFVVVISGRNPLGCQNSTLHVIHSKYIEYITISSYICIYIYMYIETRDMPRRFISIRSPKRKVTAH